jgi:hypothetical protein
MTAPIRHPICAAITAARVGHNGGPLMEDVNARVVFSFVGPRPDTALPTFDCGAPWTGYASRDELIRLSRLQRRIEVKERGLRDLRAERTKIMMRCVRRMRRAEGRE